MLINLTRHMLECLSSFIFLIYSVIQLTLEVCILHGGFPAVRVKVRVRSPLWWYGWGGAPLAG